MSTITIFLVVKTPYLRLLLPCDRTFLDMYQQVTAHEKLDPELSRITQTCINQNFVSINFGLSITLTEHRWADY